MFGIVHRPLVKASDKAAFAIYNLLQFFQQTSGQKVNFDKSTINYFSNSVLRHKKDGIASILNIPHKLSIGKYLGIRDIISSKDKEISKEFCYSEFKISCLVGSHVYCPEEANKFWLEIYS